MAPPLGEAPFEKGVPRNFFLRKKKMFPPLPAPGPIRRQKTPRLPNKSPQKQSPPAPLKPITQKFLNFVWKFFSGNMNEKGFFPPYETLFSSPNKPFREKFFTEKSGQEAPPLCFFKFLNFWKAPKI